MWQWMVSHTGSWLQPEYHRVWSHLASTIRIASALMASQWPPGRMESCWCGMRPASTPLPLPIHQVPPGRRRHSSFGRGEEDSQVRSPQPRDTHACLHPSGHRDIGSLQATDHGVPQKELGQHLAQEPGDERSTTYLFQRLSASSARVSASVLGTTCTGQLSCPDFFH